MDRYPDLSKFAFGEKWCACFPFFLSSSQLFFFSFRPLFRQRKWQKKTEPKKAQPLFSLSLSISPRSYSLPFPSTKQQQQQHQGLLAPHPLPDLPLRRHAHRLHHHRGPLVSEDCRARRPGVELGRRRGRGPGALDRDLHGRQPVRGAGAVVPLAVLRVDDRRARVGVLRARRVHRVARARQGRRRRGGGGVVRVRRGLGFQDLRSAGLQRRERDRDRRVRLRR